jgi:hypothetical protein
MMQSIPDLQSALVSYQEAQQRINDRRRSRGFWPLRSRGKGVSHGGRKGGGKGAKEELLARISRAHFYKLCGALGHWKAECPNKRDAAREQANVVHVEELSGLALTQVIIEEDFEARWMSKGV